MSLDRDFSEETKKMIAGSRKIAIDLGYDYISTMHFLLADCMFNNKYSIKDFAFDSNEEFDIFIKKQKIGESSILVDSLPLTTEAEDTVSRGCRLWSNSRYIDTEIRPYHFFLAASQLRKSHFYLLFGSKNDLFESLERFYIEIGQIDKKNIHKSFFSRVLRY